MEQTWKQKTWTALGLIAITLLSVNCSKSKTSTAAATTTAGYVTCPTTGYYTNAYSQNVACTPGTTVYTGTTAATTGYTTCPAVGYYTNAYGQAVACTAGTQVYTGTTTSSTGVCTNGYYVMNGITYPCSTSTGTTSTVSNGCATYTAMYGVTYVPVYRSGQLMCVRQDLAASGYY